MKRIMDIYGHFANYDQAYDLENCWYGRVIVKEDNTFLGYGESYYGDENLVLFGDLSKDAINTYVFDETVSFAKLYKCEKEDSKYYGTCFFADGFLELELGECKLTVMDADKTRETTNEEIQMIEKETELLMTNLNETQRKIYNNLVDMNYKNNKKIK